MLSGPSCMLVFVFSINSLILSGFPLNYFHLAKATLSAFSWFYTALILIKDYDNFSVSSAFRMD